MVDPISIIVTALATGAAAALKPMAEKAIKDAYEGLKTLIQRKYRQVNIEVLESDPASQPRQSVVTEDLKKTDAGNDEEVLRQVMIVLDVIKKFDPAVAKVVGVSLEDIESAQIAIEDIISTGDGVRIKQARVKKGLSIKKVRAGIEQQSSN